LLRLGKPEPAWSHLAAQADPRVATEIIHRAAASGVAPELLAQKLDDEPRADIRRALLLALGEYASDSGLADGVRKRALELFQRDPDPGVHSAARWLLKTKGHGTDLKKADAGLVGSGASPDRNWFVNGQGQTFSVVRGPVTFLMGAPANEGNLLSPEEGNQRLRKIDRSFALSIHEVTNAEFQRFLDEYPDVDHTFDRFYSNDPDGPVCNVTWFNAARYCRWLTAMEGMGEDAQCYAPAELKPREGDGKLKPVAIELKVGYLARAGYRLPTDAEWECAARGGTTTPRSFGWSDERLGAYEWSTSRKSFAIERPHTVGQLRPNPVGLFDMLGNIAEWTSTREDITLHPAPDGSVNDPEQPGQITRDVRLIFRGATAGDPPTVFRSSWRLPARSDVQTPKFGFRIARTIQ
jgi:formylglycine-generating enzyme required for sulfatase activity